MPETQTTAPATFADAEVVLAQRLPGYESRPQQQALAAAVENVLAETEPTTLLGEAGCGTGKSLGLMIPAILSGKKTIVATGTIALMEQYANSDVPFLEKNLGVDFKWALLKGRANYFCFAKASQADKMRFDWIPQVEAEVTSPDHSGDKEHVATPYPASEWYAVSSSSNECPGKRECPFGSICKAEAAKAVAKDADLVVTNTAMLMTDLVLRKATDDSVAMLGDYEVVIIDEAHELEEWATNALSTQIKRSGIESLLTKAENLAGEQAQSIERQAADVRDSLDEVWKALDAEQRQARFNDPTRLPQDWFLGHSEAWLALINNLRELAVAIDGITLRHGDAKRNESRQKSLSRQAMNASAKVEGALLDSDGETVRWIEKETVKRGHSTVEQTGLFTAPVHVGSFLQEMLWSRVPVALASATLSNGGDFTYIAGRLGLQDPTMINVGTPFDYTTQARLFVPTKDVASPKDKAAWMQYAMRTTINLIDAAGGGALLLFTSRKAMQESYSHLSEEIQAQGHTVLMQGQDGTNKEIAKRFADDKTSVLFALRSFLTGVDFSGDTCRLVVIDKMPFPVPSEPVFAARSDMIKRRGGSDFSELSIPAMTLTLVQGYGRLIRSKRDKGVVAILDSRLTGTGYGRGILKALPASPQIHTIDAAREFFAG